MKKPSMPNNQAGYGDKVSKTKASTAKNQPTGKLTGTLQHGDSCFYKKMSGYTLGSHKSEPHKGS